LAYRAATYSSYLKGDQGQAITLLGGEGTTYGLSGKGELDWLFKEAKMQESVGPFYSSSEQEGFSITYPMFIRGERRDMRYFQKPLEGTWYYIEGCDMIKQSTVVGRIVPEEELPSDVHLSQLSQDLLKDNEPSSGQGFLESTRPTHCSFLP
jgi:hypothetical protein